MPTPTTRPLARASGVTRNQRRSSLLDSAAMTIATLSANGPITT
jgi:hypothetical protein